LPFIFFCPDLPNPAVAQLKNTTLRNVNNKKPANTGLDELISITIKYGYSL
jgi:hypothetical protein